MCTSINSENFYTIHHEMGHIEYFMAYSSQPTIFKNGANSAFHEAIGDTIGLSVMTPKHLTRVGLLDSDETTYSLFIAKLIFHFVFQLNICKINPKKEQDINNLMKMALSKVAFLPFGYLMDKWRWNVFRGSITDANYNQEWWKMV